MNLKDATKICVDFDGTLFSDDWPNIKTPSIRLIDHVKHLRSKGVKITLFTCREDKRLEEAIEACKKLGLEFDAVNENLPEDIKKYGGTCRKPYADIYIDDKAINPNQLFPCEVCKHLDLKVTYSIGKREEHKYFSVFNYCPECGRKNSRECPQCGDKCQEYYCNNCDWYES